MTQVIIFNKVKNKTSTRQAFVKEQRGELSPLRVHFFKTAGNL